MLEGQIKLNNRGPFDTPKQDDRSKILSGNLEDKVVVNIVGKTFVLYCILNQYQAMLPCLGRRKFETTLNSKRTFKSIN